MKKVLLSSLFALVAGTSVFAQVCTPDPQYTTFGVYPPQDTLDIGATPNGLKSPLPCGVIGCPYSATFTAVIPASVPLGGTTLNICNVQLVSMSTVGGGAFPAGLSYATLPANGIFPANTSGCAKISGTPTVAAKNDIEIYTKVKINLGLGCGAGITRDQHFPSRSGETLTTKGRYVLTVLASATDACPTPTFSPCVVGTDDLNKMSMQVGIAPNPTSGITYLKVASQQAGFVNFKVTNVYGQTVVEQVINFIAAENNIIEFDGSSLPAGAYYFTIDNGKDKISDKIVVQH